jgi:hypothetical protein
VLATEVKPGHAGQAGCCSDNNSRFLLSDLSAFATPSGGEGDHFFFADRARAGSNHKRQLLIANWFVPNANHARSTDGNANHSSICWNSICDDVSGNGLMFRRLGVDGEGSTFGARHAKGERTI